MNKISKIQRIKWILPKLKNQASLTFWDKINIIFKILLDNK